MVHCLVRLVGSGVGPTRRTGLRPVLAHRNEDSFRAALALLAAAAAAAGVVVVVVVV